MHLHEHDPLFDCSAPNTSPFPPFCGTPHPSRSTGPRFDCRRSKRRRFLRFEVRHTPLNQQDPVSTIGGPREVRFLHFAVCQTPLMNRIPFRPWPIEHKAVSSFSRYARPRFRRLFRPSRLAPDEQHVFRCLPVNTAHSVASL